MADVTFDIDEVKLKRLAFGSDKTYQLVKQKRDATQAKANAYGGSFRTQVVYDFETHEKVGGTKAVYGGGTKRFRTSDGASIPVGIVHPMNYAAMKDNFLHNTLLKSL